MSKSTDQPPKRVKVTLACTICRKKKVKCDGVQPTCSRCQSIGICCQYSDRPTKRGPPKGYVEVIENRAQRIKSILGTANQQLPASIPQQPLHPHVASNNSVNNLAPVDVASKSPQPTKHSANALLCLIADTVDAALQQERAATQLVHGSNGMMYAFPMTNNVLQSPSSLLQLEHISADTWTESFFSHFNFIFPILSRPLFRFQLENEELNTMLKLAVFLLGCRLNNDIQDVAQEKALYQQFDDLFTNASHDDMVKADLSTVQATVIMCWYTYLAGDLHKCYALRHHLSVLVHQLTLDYESPNDKQDMHQIEMKRRAYWVSFVVDQWLAGSTGRDAFISRQSHVQYPQLEDNQLFALSHPSSYQHQDQVAYSTSVEYALQINSFREMIQLAYIISDVSKGVASEADVSGWLFRLPSYLDYGKMIQHVSPAPIARMYRILFYTVQIMLSRTTRHEPSNSICTTAATTIIHISEQMLEQGQAKYLRNIFPLSITLATSIHLDNALLSSKDDNEFDKLNFSKSMALFKEAHCSLLSRPTLEDVLRQFLVGNFNFALDNGYPSPSNSASWSPASSKPSKNNNNKRPYVADNEEEEQFLLASPSSSTFTAPDYSSNSMLPNDFYAEQRKFDINDIFPVLMNEQQQQPQQQEHTFDTHVSTEQNLPPWIGFFDNVDPSASCSPASYLTPTQSPSISLNHKDEGPVLFDILSDPQFFTATCLF
ncbi:hypothetical protein [Parasitella parasitica]|uniref:Zn(2)-C6 fungal-type domain-containing protein n=1 Tax=Parasitella parasitica TaxID=35722 RepID=A0A0B7NEU2_9FUNG|nr:hypothetical protein [Parasitella parasitica]